MQQQVETLGHDVYPGNRVLVTAREAGYCDDTVFGDDFVRLDVQRLDNRRNRTLVARWCRQLYPDPDEADQRTVNSWELSGKSTTCVPIATYRR